MATENTDNQPAVNAEVKPKKSRKKLVLFGVIILIVLAVTAALLWFFVLNKKDNTSPVQTKADPVIQEKPQTIDQLKTSISNTPVPTTSKEQVALAVNYLNLGNLYTNSGDYQNALDSLDKVYDPSILPAEVLQTVPEINMYAQVSFGVVYFNMGEYQKSVDAYNKALTIANQKNTDGSLVGGSHTPSYQELLDKAKAKL